MTAKRLDIRQRLNRLRRVTGKTIHLYFLDRSGELRLAEGRRIKRRQNVRYCVRAYAVLIKFEYSDLQYSNEFRRSEEFVLENTFYGNSQNEALELAEVELLLEHLVVEL